MRQGNDVGSQYRSAIYCMDAQQRSAAEASRERFQQRLSQAGFAQITTEIAAAPPFYYAEAYHQQYLAKNPWRLLRTRRDRRLHAGLMRCSRANAALRRRPCCLANGGLGRRKTPPKRGSAD